MPFETEEPYLAVVRGGQVGWWEMADSAPEVMTEMVFTIRAAQSTGGMRDISLCMDVRGLRQLAEKAQQALALAEEFEDNGLPDSVREMLRDRT